MRAKQRNDSFYQNFALWIPDDDQADVEALDSPVVADQVEEQLSLLRLGHLNTFAI